MTDRGLYWRETAAARPAWEVIDPPRPVAPFGDHIVHVGPRANFILRGARSPEFCEPAPSDLPRGSSWTSDESQLALRVSQARYLADTLSTLPGALARTEYDIAKKWCLQKGAMYGWDVSPEGLGLPGGGSIREAVRLIARDLFHEGVPAPTWTSYPRDSNAGAPSYSRGILDKIASALCAFGCDNWDDFGKVFSQLGGVFGGVREPHAILFSRTGPTAKALATYSISDRCFHVANATGVAPRRRHVFGVPSMLNIFNQGYATALKAALLRDRGFHHPSKIATLVKLSSMQRRVAAFWGRAYVYQDDISGFDQSVRRIHQLEFAEEFLSYVMGPEAIEVWLEVARLAVLAPPLNAAREGFLYRRRWGGVTTSGDILTTIVGTVVNAARVVTAYAAAEGCTVARAWADRGTRWEFLAWGDDTVLITGPHFKFEKYQKASLDLGYTSAGLPGAVFLMTFYDLERMRFFPLASRVWQQTTANERGGRTPELEMLSLFMRSYRLEDNPYGGIVWELLRTSAPSMDKWGVNTPADLPRLFTDPGFMATMESSLSNERDYLRDILSRVDRSGGLETEVAALLRNTFGARLDLETRVTLDGLKTVPKHTALAQGLRLYEYLARPKDERGAPPTWAEELVKLTEGGPDGTEEGEGSDQGDAA